MPSYPTRLRAATPGFGRSTGVLAVCLTGVFFAAACESDDGPVPAPGASAAPASATTVTNETAGPASTPTVSTPAPTTPPTSTPIPTPASARNCVSDPATYAGRLEQLEVDVAAAMDGYDGTWGFALIDLD